MPSKGQQQKKFFLMTNTQCFFLFLLLYEFYSRFSPDVLVSWLPLFATVLHTPIVVCKLQKSGDFNVVGTHDTLFLAT